MWLLFGLCFFIIQYVFSLLLKKFHRIFVILLLLQKTLADGGGKERAKLTERLEKILQQHAATRELLLPFVNILPLSLLLLLLWLYLLSALDSWCCF